MADDPASTRQTREKGRLLDGRKWDYQPLAAIEFHVRIRGAPCVGFFSCHDAQSFSLDIARLGRELPVLLRRGGLVIYRPVICR